MEFSILLRPLNTSQVVSDSETFPFRQVIELVLTAKRKCTLKNTKELTLVKKKCSDLQTQKPIKPKGCSSLLRTVHMSVLMTAKLWYTMHHRTV